MVFFTCIWERYFLKELLKAFLLFLCSFYALYLLIDYSNHSQSFHHYRFSLFDVALYYGYEFVVRMHVLVPFALLIACIKTLCSLNTHCELIALMAGGIKLRRLLMPFIILGLFLTAINFLNSEYLEPKAMMYHQHLEHLRAKQKKSKYDYPHIQQLSLEDGSSLIFQRYDQQSGQFFDVFWIRHLNDIYRIKDLILSDEGPVGYSVQHLERDAHGALKLTEQFEKKLFETLKLDKTIIAEAMRTPDALALSALQKKLTQLNKLYSEKDARLVTAYYYKLAIPWLSLLAVIACAPFCIAFSRALPQFFIYAFSIFGLVAFYLLMNAAVILGERQVVPPAIAIWLPFGLLYLVFGLRFLKRT
jgi:lipopolysaccharide export system permease protein